MGSPFSTIAVILSLLFSFMQAPSSHVHEHQSTQHHQGGLFHIHLPHADAYRAGQPEMRGLDPDDDAVFDKWFSVTQNGPEVMSVVLTDAPVLPAPEPRKWRAEPVQPSAHDPPELLALPPRSPPA